MGHGPPRIAICSAGCRGRRIERRRRRSRIIRRRLNLSRGRGGAGVDRRCHTRGRSGSILRSSRIGIAGECRLRIVHGDLLHSRGSRKRARRIQAGLVESRLAHRRRIRAEDRRIDAVLREILGHAGSGSQRGTPLLDGHRNLLIGHTAVRHGDDVLSRQIRLRPNPLCLTQQSLLILGRPAVRSSAGCGHLLSGVLRRLLAGASGESGCR